MNPVLESFWTFIGASVSLAFMPEMNLDLSKPWTEFEFIAFDTETSGAYPLGSEVVEFGAVKWKGGKEIATYQTLLRPSKPMSDFIIGIHGITNEMVEAAPMMAEKIMEIHQFFQGAIPMAHHAPFDMGFLAIDFEKHQLIFPKEPVICTSLLARKVIHETPNHKLQTLVNFLKLEGGTAHRALDDAKSCLYVGLECMNRLGPLTSLEEVLKVVEKDLSWKHYSTLGSGSDLIIKVIECVQKNLCLDIVYEGGKAKNETRRITPIGIVRNPDGDYVMATCHRDGAQKRFYLGKIKDAVIAYA